MTDTDTMVTMHSEMGRDGHPAVNVKVYWSTRTMETLLPLSLCMVKEAGDADFRSVETDPGFTLDWIDSHLTEDEQQSWWNLSCEDHFEQAEELAKETFGSHVKVYSEGRSGGWLVVYGLGDVEDWNADEVEQWTTFADQVRAIADDVPYGYLWNVNANVYEPHVESLEAGTLTPEGVSATVEGERALKEVSATCRYCRRSVYPVIVWESQVVDWEDNGDSGCPDNPESDDEGTAGHLPLPVN